MRDLTGQNLGKYQVQSEIGRGGMGVVYRAYDQDLRRHVALKVLLPQLVNNQQFLERFRREAVTVANLKHPNIVTVHDVGTTLGYYYIVMELLEGYTLRQEIERTGALPLARTTCIVHQLAAALDYAHHRGVIHRDVKASNIVIAQNDHITLTDFGLAKLRQDVAGGVSITQAGLALGTLKCMAPEQITGEQIDHRADIYALGVVTYEMLGGRLPYAGNTPQELFQGILLSPPIPITQIKPNLPIEVEGVLTQALAKQAHDRFDTAGEMAILLQRLRPATGIKLVDQDGREYTLSGLVNSMGRNPDNNIVLNDTQVSRYHAEIRSQASTWFVTDQGSTNGTFVNEQRLTPHIAHPLQPGDRLRLGNRIVLYIRESQTALRRPAQTTTI